MFNFFNIFDYYNYFDIPPMKKSHSTVDNKNESEEITDDEKITDDSEQISKQLNESSERCCR